MNISTHTASEYVNSSSAEKIQEKKEVNWSLHNTGFICLKIEENKYCKIRNFHEDFFSQIALKDIFAMLKIRE